MNGVTGLLGNPLFMMGAGLLGSPSNPWGGAMQGLLSSQAYDWKQSKQRLEEEQAARQAQIEQMQIQSLKDSKQREDITRAMTSAINMNPGAYQSPEAQQMLRTHLAGWGDTKMAEQAGVLPPVQNPMTPEQLLSKFTPESVQKYMQTKQITDLVRNPPQMTPRQPLGVQDLIGNYTPESIKAWQQSGDISSLAPYVKPSPSAQENRLKEVQDLAAVQQSASELRSMITNPAFSGAVGIIDKFTGKVGAQFGSEEGLLSRKAERMTSQLVTKTIKSLGANPSDRDMETVYKTIPSVGDSPEVWEDWYNNEFVPTINARARMTPGVERDVVDPINARAAATKSARDYLNRFTPRVPR